MFRKTPKPVPFTFLLLLLLLATSSGLKAQGSGKLVTYSLDSLPNDWLAKPRLLRAIDVLLPPVIPALRNGRSCRRCAGDYLILLHVDTVFIVSSDLVNNVPATSKGFSTNYDKVTTFKFRSYLSVMDKNGQEVSRLVVNNPEEPQLYRVQDHEYARRERCTVPVVYPKDQHSNPAGTISTASRTGSLIVPKGLLQATLPTDSELVDFIAGKLINMRARFESMN